MSTPDMEERYNALLRRVHAAETAKQWAKALDKRIAALQARKEKYREADRVDRLEQVGGGVQAVVRDGDHPYQPWAGIVEGEFISECDCPDVHDDLCRHAVAVALLAFDEKVRRSGSAAPPGVADLGDARFVEAARRLARRQLVTLVVEQAGRDRLFAEHLAGLVNQCEYDTLPDVPRAYAHLLGAAGVDTFSQLRHW